MPTTELQVAVEFGATTVRPGQTLVLTCPKTISADYAAAIKARLQDKLPGVDIVIAAGFTQALVYEPAEGQDG